MQRTGRCPRLAALIEVGCRDGAGGRYDDGRSIVLLVFICMYGQGKSITSRGRRGGEDDYEG